MSLRILFLTFIAGALANPLDMSIRDTCNPCNPSGATGSTPPSIGSDLKSLYTDVLESVKDIHFNKRWIDPMQPRDDDFCCAETLDCVNVANLNIPMCYDKFTTNFAFADRSYGSLTTGDYTQGGSQANLLTGSYSKDGIEGNIYSDDPSAKPNTATLSIPPQFTGSGVGSAIPPTAIVGSATPAATSGQSTGTAKSQSTGPSTSTNAQTSGAASSTDTPGAAIRCIPESGRSLIMSAVTVLLYTLYTV